MAVVLRALADCPDCGGEGAVRGQCGRCARCRGEGVVLVPVDDGTFFSDLPPDMSRDDARALLERIHQSTRGNS